MSSRVLSINSNISSLTAQRQLGAASLKLSSSFEKLSSGLRINRASDDAAGLAVASSLRADTRIYSQGVRNLNDGVSALNIADGALSNLSSIVTRMQELAEQAANGAVGWRQRKSLDAEAQALAKEYFRISKTTDFNGLKLLDGSIQGLTLQAGYGTGGSILSTLGGTLGTGTFTAALSYQCEVGGGLAASRSIATADVNGDGFLDLISAGQIGVGPTQGYATIRLGNGDGTFRSSLSYGTDTEQNNSVSISDVNGDGALDLVTAGVDGTCGRAVIRLGNGDGTFRSSYSYETESSSSSALSISDINGDGVPDLVTAGSGAGGGRATVRIGKGDGTFHAAYSYATESSSSSGLSLSDVNGDGRLDLVTAGVAGPSGGATIRIGNGDGTFGASRSYQTESVFSNALFVSDVNEDGALDLVTAGMEGVAGCATIRLGNGDGTFRASLSYRTEIMSSYALTIADLNGDGLQDLVTAGSDGAWGRATLRLGNGDGTFRSALSYRTEAYTSFALTTSDLNGDGALDLISAGTDFPGGRVTTRLATTRDGISPVLPFSLKTQADALQALPAFQRTLSRLSVQRGQIGAFQSRLSSALSTLGSTVLEYKGAQSRVEDVDVASESANLVRQQILQQAAAGVLAQANQTPALALQLLNG